MRVALLNTNYDVQTFSINAESKRGEEHAELFVFNQVTLDGYFADMNGDLSWAHKNDAEWNAFVADNAKGGGLLLFGRITYELMASYWPTPYA
ncbi:MAG TPA: hypothetical protein VES69_13490, partial [Pyrinomonadaceae bacterium]|nr:hypothetical protein [Pyrinomonadaceae bacterium]